MPTLNFTPSTLIKVIDNLLNDVGEIVLTGEIKNIKISAEKWVFIEVADMGCSVSCFLPISRYGFDLKIGNRAEFLVVAKLTNKAKFSLTIYRYLKLLDIDQLAQKRALDYQKIIEKGYLDPQRKKTLPLFPNKIALITSDNSSALADFEKILSSRNPAIMVDFFPSSVQGVLALRDLKKILKYLSLSHEYDAIVVIRGGGSKDDLSTFDDYELAVQIAKLKTPIVLGIGHEDNFSLGELVADLRASTPTDAANLISTSLSDLINSYQIQLTNFGNQMDNQLELLLSDCVHCQDVIRNTKMRIITDLESHANHYQELINLNDPKTILAKGYSIVRYQNKVVQKLEDLPSVGNLSIELKNGKLALEYVKKN